MSIKSGRAYLFIYVFVKYFHHFLLFHFFMLIQFVFFLLFFYDVFMISRQE